MRKAIVCTVCGEGVPKKDGKCSSCLFDYKRDYQYRRLYGITLAQFNERLEEQEYRCAICGSLNPRQFGKFQVDHDHATGEVRGLLCSKCNKGLMLFNDDVETLEKAVKYLHG